MERKEKAKRLCLKTLLIGSAMLCVGALIGASIAVLTVYKQTTPPDIVCTYSATVSHTYTVKPTMKTHAFTSEIYSKKGAEPNDFLYAVFYHRPDFESSNVQKGKVLTTLRSFFSRTMCFVYNEQSTCQKITKGVQKASWDAPCPTDPSVQCDVYTAQSQTATTMYNETWYLFPESYFPDVTERVPSASYVETEYYRSLNLFENVSLDSPPEWVFQTNFSEYCYEVNNPNEKGTETSSSSAQTTTSTSSSSALRATIASLLPTPNRRLYDFDKVLSQFKPADMRHISEYQNMNYYQNIYIGGGDGGNGAAMLTKSETSRNARRDVAIPESFDSRAKWENCITISSIRDQGDCGACWSFSAVQVLADRFCVKGQMVPELSAQYLIDCFGDSGCVGGYADVAWERLVTNGTVSEKCSSYIENVGVCNNTCWSSQEEQFKLYKASTGYSLYVEGNFTATSELIQLEIMEKGPVGASLFVYNDFYDYKKGVYAHKSSAAPVGMHSIKIVGWGVEEKTLKPYWIASNTWGKKWGGSGFFKILRGSNECGIEYMITAGDPLIVES